MDKHKNNIKRNCLFCGKEFFTRQYRIDKGYGKYCSLSCSSKNTKKFQSMPMYGSDNPNWKGGISKDHMRYKRIQQERYPEKIKARTLLLRAVKENKMKRGSCIICGDINSHGHHEDYSKPLEVVWVCRKHHREIHGNKH